MQSERFGNKPFFLLPDRHIELFKKLFLSNIYENKINMRVKTNCFYVNIIFVLKNVCLIELIENFNMAARKKGLFSDLLERTLCKINSGSKSKIQSPKSVVQCP